MVWRRCCCWFGWVFCVAGVPLWHGSGSASLPADALPLLRRQAQRQHSVLHTHIADKHAAITHAAAAALSRVTLWDMQLPTPARAAISQYAICSTNAPTRHLLHATARWVPLLLCPWGGAVVGAVLRGASLFSPGAYPLLQRHLCIMFISSAWKYCLVARPQHRRVATRRASLATLMLCAPHHPRPRLFAA